MKGLASWQDGKLTQHPEVAGALIGLFLEDREQIRARPPRRPLGITLLQSVPEETTPGAHHIQCASDLVRARCGTRSEGWVFPSNRAASGHLRSIDLSSGRPADKRAFRRNSFSIVRGMITAQGFSCGRGTWLPS